MPTVILELLDDSGSSTVSEAIPHRIDAERRATELSHRMTNLGVAHRVSCLDDSRRDILFHDVRGRLVGSRADDFDGLAFYEADVEADYERFHRKEGR